MSFYFARAYSWLNRFSTLQRAVRVFRDVRSPTVVRKGVFGYVMDLDVSRSSAQQLLLLEGERFIEERFLVQSLLHEGMTVVDVGSNIGYYLLMFEHSVRSSGKVICIEPSVENLPELERNIALNGFSNVRLEAVALGAVDGETGLQSGINSGVVEGDAGTYRVPLRRLDEVVREPVDFVKIDVEGYEGHVLNGATQLIDRHHPIVFLELHPFIVKSFGHSTRSIVDFLGARYRSIQLYEKRSLGIWSKFAVRYLGRDPLAQVEDLDEYVTRCDEGTVLHTSWVVCRP